MAWEWAAPTATAVTAVSGFIATVVVSRTGTKAQRELQSDRHQRDMADKVRNEKMEAYISFLAQVDEGLYILMSQQPRLAKHKKELSLKVSAIYNGLATSLVRVALVCSPEIDKLAHDLTDAVTSRLFNFLIGKSPTDDAPNLRWQFVEAARRDLGYESSP